MTKIKNKNKKPTTEELWKAHRDGMHIALYFESDSELFAGIDMLPFAGPTELYDNRLHVREFMDSMLVPVFPLDRWTYIEIYDPNEEVEE